MRDLFVDTLVSERFAIDVLSKYLHIKKNKFKHLTASDSDNPVDIMYEGIRFDVKFSNPTLASKEKTKKVWDFDLRGKKDYCDWLVLIGMQSYRPVKVFLVPTIEVPVHHIRVSIEGISKWHKYLIWETNNYERKN